MSSPSDTEDDSLTRHLSGQLLDRTGLSRLKSYPTDLSILCLAVGAGALVVAAFPPGSTLRFVAAGPLLFVLPGYALVSALYPAAGDLRWAASDETTARFALAFGLSLALVPLTVIAVGAVGSPGVAELLGTVAIGSVVLAQVAVVRRLRLPPHQRYRPGVRHRARRAIGQRFSGGRRVATVTAILLAVGVVAAATALTVAVAQPPSANDFTQLSVATEDEDGSLSTVDYPDELTLDDSTPLVVSVTNHESSAEDYTLLVRLQAVDDVGTVLETESLDRFDDSVAVGDTWRVEHEPAPDLSGDDLRLQYLLYRGDVPETPTRENAYRDVHVWVSAS